MDNIAQLAIAHKRHHMKIEKKNLRETGVSETVSKKLLGNAYILTATIFFGVNIPVVKDLIPTWLTDTDVTAIRIAGGCALMWIASLFIHTEKIERNDWRNIIVGGMLGLFSFMWLFNMSLRYADPIDVSIIMTLPPVFVIIINALRGLGRPNLPEGAGVIIAFAGATLVILVGHSGKHGQDEILGNVLALISGLCYAFYLVIIEKPSKKYRPVSLLRWVFLMALIPTIILIPSLFHAPLFHTSSASPWIEISFVVICPTFLAYFLVSPATKLIGSEIVSIYQYLVPVVACIASVMMHIAHLRLIQAVAMIVIIIGMLVTTRAHSRRINKSTGKNP